MSFVRLLFRLTNDDIFGHVDFSKTICFLCGENWKKFRRAKEASASEFVYFVTSKINKQSTAGLVVVVAQFNELFQVTKNTRTFTCCIITR